MQKKLFDEFKYISEKKMDKLIEEVTSFMDNKKEDKVTSIFNNYTFLLPWIIKRFS